MRPTNGRICAQQLGADDIPRVVPIRIAPQVIMAIGILDGESMIAIPQSWSFRAFAGSNSNAQLSVMGCPTAP